MKYEDNPFNRYKNYYYTRQGAVDACRTDFGGTKIRANTTSQPLTSNADHSSKSNTKQSVRLSKIAELEIEISVCCPKSTVVMFGEC